MKSSIISALCLSFISMVCSKEILPGVPNPNAETAVPAATITEAVEATEVANVVIDDKYFSCDIDDWKCKAEMSKKCFDDANECHLEEGTPIEDCIKILNACERIWNY